MLLNYFIKKLINLKTLMKKITQVFILSLVAFCAFGQENFNLELVAQVENGETGNDVWGYVDTSGVEYAIMGTRTRTKIWSLEDPSNPIERASIPGPAGTWRDIKSFEDHIYVTSDQGAEGLLIIDMSMAPDSITFEYWNPEIEIDGFSETMDKCHNLYIDDGYCYLAGCDVGEGGIIILDLKKDKKLPEIVNVLDSRYSHDVYVQDNKMYTSDIFQGRFNVYDVTDKTDLILLGGAETSRRFTHNAWLSDDGNFLFTTDERPNAWVDAFDISDLNDIQFLDRYQPIETEGTGVIPHNTHYHQGFLVTSWYTDGLVIVDANKPDNLVKVAAYDTELEIPSGFEGCWGAYPFLPSGLILAGDMNHGLFIFRPKRQDGEEGYQRACYLEGMVTDKITGQAVRNATVRILSDNPNEANTELTGGYKTGQVTPGEFMVEFTHPNYNTLTTTATLINGEVTILNVEMENSLLEGTVTDIDGNPLENAGVVIENLSENIRIEATTDENGNWAIGAREDLDYGVYAAQWGFKGASQNINFVNGTTVELMLEEGYEDDFFTDLGWTVSGDASSGEWEIARPNFIFGSGQTTQTSSDIEGDIGSTYYVTGANGGSQGANDIDDGATVLTSQPMDFTGFERIDFSYYLWFVNVGGDSAPNDFVTVSVTNGIETIELTRIDQNGTDWSPLIETFLDNTQMEFNSEMRIIVRAEDVGPGHVVEAGFDSFKAVGFMPTSIIDYTVLGLSVFPNPASEYITLRSDNAWQGEKIITIIDNMGRVMLQNDLTDPEMKIDISQLNSGIYTIQVIGSTRVSETIKFSKL